LETADISVVEISDKCSRFMYVSAVGDVSALCAFDREHLVNGCFKIRTYKVNPWTLTLTLICLSNSPLETATVVSPFNIILMYHFTDVDPTLSVTFVFLN